MPFAYYFSKFGGGSEVQLYLLSKEFSKNDNIEVNVITGNYGDRNNHFEVKKKIKIYKVLPLKRGFINYFEFVVNFFFTYIK